jgi:hypothetical protein
MNYGPISKAWITKEERDSEIENRIEIYPNIKGNDGIEAYCGAYAQFFSLGELAQAMQWVEDNATVLAELKGEAETFTLLRTTSFKEAWKDIGAYGRVLARTSERIKTLQLQLKEASGPTLSSYDSRPKGN